ncbi:hypothetical protein CRG98_031712 [Punica granatum]|uniref:Uncharacterized protein n=1 Tax=Punica granatum TaxID=22663 RepID=A0A2I0IVB0_PUNGR|nr:hypothetical protein CRG98_031712 [Punica granatum]
MKFLLDRAGRDTDPRDGSPRAKRGKARIFPRPGGEIADGSRGPGRTGDGDCRRGSFEQVLRVHGISRKKTANAEGRRVKKSDAAGGGGGGGRETKAETTIE